MPDGRLLHGPIHVFLDKEKGISLGGHIEEPVLCGSREIKKVDALYNEEPVDAGILKRFLDSVSPNNEGCVLMDIHMPESDGFELIKRMSILNYTVRVIFITALAETGDYERAVQAGVDGFLLKPFTDQSLLDLIGAVSDSMYRKKAKHSGEER